MVSRFSLRHNVCNVRCFYSNPEVWGGEGSIRKCRDALRESVGKQDIKERRCARIRLDGSQRPVRRCFRGRLSLRHGIRDELLDCLACEVWRHETLLTCIYSIHTSQINSSFQAKQDIRVASVQQSTCSAHILLPDSLFGAHAPSSSHQICLHHNKLASGLNKQDEGHDSRSRNTFLFNVPPVFANFSITGEGS